MKIACALCGKEVDEADLCGDLACRNCHKSLSFEECFDGSWERRVRQQAGLSAPLLEEAGKR